MSYCGTEKFGKAFVDSMNFENRDQFGNTMALLDLISSVYNLASSGSYSSEYKVIDTIKNTLDKAFSEKKGSYLLHRKTEQILDQIENHSFVNMKEEIFEIQKGVWCLPSSEGLKLSKKENNDNIEKIQAEIKVLRQHLTPPQHLIDEAIKNGQQYVEWTPDRRTIMKYRQLGDDLLVYFTEPLKVDDLVMQSSGDTTVNLYEFQFMLSAQMRKKIESDFGISISDLSMPEQYQLLDYIRNMTFAEVESVVSFTKKFGRDAFRTFLSLESGGRDMGDKILILGDETKFPRPLAEKLFNKYGSFVDSANNIQEGISHLLGNKGTLDTSKISEKLLVRAKNLLVEYADKAQQGEVDEQRMDEDLDHIHQEIAVLGYAYIEMARQGDYTDLEDLGKVNVAVRTSSEYSEKEKEELEKVYEYSRPKETFENPEHIRLLRKEFRESLDREDVTVFEVDLDNKKIAFALLYYKDPKTLHMGGLSFHPDARNPAVGLAVMESMAKNLGNYTIEAEVHSENKILAMYTNRFGFTIVGEEPREKNAGELYYMIRREPTADKTAPIE